MIGRYDDNPTLNYTVYDLELLDSTIKNYSDNLIAENLLTYVDSDEFTLTMMGGVIDHNKDESSAVSREDTYISCPRGQIILWKTIIG